MWNPGHVIKAKKRIAELLKAVNLVLEIRDSRAPFATGAYDRRSLLRGKRTVIVLNKADISDEETTEKWERYFRDRDERVIISRKGDRSKTLIKRLFGGSVNIRVLVVGLPNVGKSSFINRIKGKRAAKIGAVPGVTKGVQWIRVNDRIRLIDTPGVIYTDLFSKKLMAKLLLVGVLTPEIADDWEAVEGAFEILKSRYPEIVKDRMGEVENLEKALQKFARKRGFLRAGGEIDENTALSKMFQEISKGTWGRMSFEDPDSWEEVGV